MESIDQIIDRLFVRELKLGRAPTVEDLAKIRDVLRAELPTDTQIDLMIFMNAIALTVSFGKAHYVRSCVVS